MANDGSDVDPDSVSQFGMRSLDELKSFVEGFSASLGSMGSAKPGASGLNESVAFGDAYAQSLQALQLFFKDAVTGLQALGYGGITIADNYRNADMSQAGEMNSVHAAFNPAPGTQSIATEQAAAEAEAAAKEAPPQDSKPLPPAQPPSHHVSQATPQEEVDHHTALVGENEHWRPEPAPKPMPPSVPDGPAANGPAIV